MILSAIAWHTTPSTPYSGGRMGEMASCQLYTMRLAREDPILKVMLKISKGSKLREMDS